ncbi:MAG: isochorismatase family protein [Candidatus Margulisbacteria bacterium]|nr:isochorismatase family protein [Candidatus Margulisiibacteriota bacterium]
MNYKIIAQRIKVGFGCIDVTPTFMDFCKGIPVQELPVPNGESIVPLINLLVRLPWNFSFASLDWHPWKPLFPQDHISFASRHKVEPFSEVPTSYGPQVAWPRHGMAGTPWAQLHPGINDVYFDMILRKGKEIDLESYSAFMYTNRKTTGLGEMIKARGVNLMIFAGLAFDYCVKYNALDSVLKFGFETWVVLDACRSTGIPEGSHEQAIAEMVDAGIRMVLMDDVIKLFQSIRPPEMEQLNMGKNYKYSNVAI